MVNNMLLATDGSDNALRAAKHTAALMQKNPEISLTIVYVRSPGENLVRFQPWISTQEIDLEMKKMAENIINRTVAVFKEAGLQVNTEIIEGDPGKAIADYAGQKGFGQIVMGSRGLSDLSGIIMGSVSHQVLHFADCPVLLVK